MLISTYLVGSIRCNAIKWQIGFVLLVTGLSAGCQLVEKKVMPSAWVLDAKVVQQTPQGAVIKIQVMIDNPSLATLPLIRSDYAIAIDGVGTFSFEDQLNRSVPAGVEQYGNPIGRQTLSLSAAIAQEGSNLVGIPYQVHGAIYYRRGQGFLMLPPNSKIRIKKVCFEGTGRLTAVDHP